MYFINRKISQIPYIQEFTQHLDQNCIVGWGRKPSFFRAKNYAQQHNLKVVSMEDGFIRSLGLGKLGYPPLSLVADYSGIYFDATQTSDLENLIAQPETHQDLTTLIDKITQNGITKYNQKNQSIPIEKFNQQKNILVVDQTFGDQSIKYAGADATAFERMYLQAKQDYPDAIIWVKTHPDVISGKAKGHFSQPDINYLVENYNSIELLKCMEAVYVVSSQLGFEALLCKKKVYCFGVPWYAGWGITEDIYAPLHILGERRQVKKSLEHLFNCAYLQYARYVSPVTHQPCDLTHILDLLIENKKYQLPEQLEVYGFSRWKRDFMRNYLDFPHSKISFRQWFKPKLHKNIMAWGKKAHKLKQENYKNIWTVEDGFIRSLGLGATLIRPYSLVFDSVGIYYDATAPSYLENLLNQKELTISQHQRAECLRQKILDNHISKYNVGTQQKIERPSHHQVILVVGQVEDDMSIQLGGVDIKTNLALLQQVRQNNPDGYIIYKPHPDVHAGLRIGKIAPETVLKYANQLELDSSILECLKIVDELHTISSLSGFEALLRDVKVFCYGLPFYAGWGLTTDRHRCERRKKHVTLTALVYMTLIEYPVYNVPATKLMRLPFVTPEIVIDLLKMPVATKKNTFISQVFTQLRRLKLGNHR